MQCKNAVKQHPTVQEPLNMLFVSFTVQVTVKLSKCLLNTSLFVLKTETNSSYLSETEIMSLCKLSTLMSILPVAAYDVPYKILVV